MQSEDRIAKIQSRLEESGIDLLAVGPTSNMRYALGYAPHADERLCLLLVSRNDACIVVPSLSAEEAAKHTGLPLIPWFDADGPQKALEQARSRFGLVKTLAIDGATRADSLLFSQAVIKPEKTTTGESILSPLRVCKSAEEIEALSRAAAQADRAMRAAVDMCNPGVTEAEIAWETEATFRKDGAEEVCFTLIASGPHGAYPHHHSGARILQKGDSIIIDIGASLNGYKSDITRMVFLGEPPKDFLQSHAIVKEANRRGRDAIRPGVPAEAIDHASRSTIAAAGYGQFFTHRTGHGIGLDIHEPPWIMAGNGNLLEAGMAFSVEPGIYLEGKYGVRVEDIVVVTPTGVRTLTGFDHELVVKE